MSIELAVAVQCRLPSAISFSPPISSTAPRSSRSQRTITAVSITEAMQPQLLHTTRNSARMKMGCCCRSPRWTEKREAVVSDFILPTPTSTVALLLLLPSSQRAATTVAPFAASTIGMMSAVQSASLLKRPSLPSHRFRPLR